MDSADDTSYNLENQNVEIESEQLEMPENDEELLLIEKKAPSRARCRKIALKVLKYVKTNILLILTIASVIIGIILGLSIKEADPPLCVQQLIAFPGEIFLRALKMLIIPLIVFSLLAGLGSVNLKLAGSLGIRTLLYYGTTTLSAVVLGIIIVVIIEPGRNHSAIVECTNSSVVSAQPIEVIDSLLDLVRNLIPDNLFTATFEQTDTQYSYVIDYHHCALHLNYTNVTEMNCSDITSLIKDDMALCNTSVKTVKSLGTRKGMNILGIIAFTIAFAMVLASFGEESGPFIRTINILNEAIMKLVMLIMWYSPVGIASIITGKLLEVDDIMQMIQELGLYMLCVLLGLLIHSCIVLPLLYTILTFSNPFKLIKGVLQALLLAFGTSSSSATLPVTMQCLEDNLHFDRRVTRFMLPVGATVNMDGTALYEAIAAVFIAQTNSSYELGLDKIIIIAITATLASIGAAGIPQAGLVTLVIVLTAIGLPAEDVALILTVDWLLDRFRTTVNVFGDCVGVGIVSRFSRKQLALPQSTLPLPDTTSTTQGATATQDHVTTPPTDNIKHDDAVKQTESSVL